MKFNEKVTGTAFAVSGAEVASVEAAAESLVGDNGFTVAATVETAKESTLVAQGDAYELSINADGYAQFTLNGSTAVSDVVVADGDVIVGVKENNGIQKIYVNGTLAGSAYSADNRFYVVEEAAIEVANATEMRVIALLTAMTK